MDIKKMKNEELLNKYRNIYLKYVTTNNELFSVSADEIFMDKMKQEILRRMNNGTE